MTSDDHDEALLRRWQEAHDPEALDELLEREIRALRRRLESPSMPGHPGSATRDDIAQEVALRWLSAERPTFPSRAALQAYLWSMARNLLIDRLRSAHVRFRGIEPRATEELVREPATRGSLDRVERGDMAAALELALHLLRPEDQEILNAVYFGGRSIEEAAREIAISRDTANTRLVRARVRLARKLEKWRDLVTG